MAFNLGTALGRIRILYNGAPIQDATEDSRRYRDAQGRLRDEMGRYARAAGESEEATHRLGRAQRNNSSETSIFIRLLGMLNKIWPLLAKGLGLFSAAVPAVQGLAAATAALLPIINALAASLPAVVLSLVAAFAVLKIATAGVGDAMKAAASGDAKKFEEALKKLSPAARDFARATFAAFKSLKPLQQAMQNNLFKDTAPLVKTFAKNLLSVKDYAIETSGAMNTIFKEVLRVAGSARSMGAIRAVLSGVTGFLLQMKPAIAPLINGFLSLGEQSIQLATQVGGHLANAVARFGDFLGTIDLVGLWDKAMPIINQIITLFVNLGQIIGAVFTALGAQGNDALGMLSQIVSVIAQFVTSEAGAAALNAIGFALQAIASGAGQIVLALMEALGPVMVALAPLVAALAQVLTGGIVQAIGALAPLLLNLASTLTSALMPVLPVITTLFNALAPIIEMVATALSGTLGAALGPIGELFGIIAPHVTRLAELLGNALTPILTALGPVLAVVAVVIGQVLAAALELIMPIFEALLPVISELATAVLPALLPLFGVLGQLIIALLPLLSVMTNLMVAILVPVLKLLSPLLVLLAQGLAIVIGWLVQIIKPITDMVAKATSIEQLGKTFDQVFSAIKTVVLLVVKLAGEAISRWIANMKSTFSTISGIVSTVVGFFTNLRTSVINKLGELLSFVGSIPGRITSALGNLGSLLADKGRDIVQGLINGISGMAGKLASFVSGFIKNNIPGPVADILGIHSPSRVAAALGKEVPRGLALGILDQAKVVKDAASTMSDILVNQLGAIPISADVAVGRAFAATSGAPALTPTATTTSSVDQSTSVSVVVNAPQNMDPNDVGNAVGSRVLLKLKTGA